VIRSAVVLAAMVVSVVAGQQPVKTPPPSDPFAPVRFLVGTWKGENSGDPGNGTSDRTYAFDLGGAVLATRNVAVYPPQPKNAKGETHQDAGFITYDRVRRALVYRQFHSEGFVNQYLRDGAAGNADTVVFVTETIENIGPGWRARETYRRTGPDTITETFELAEPRKEFEVYSVCKLTRVK
jgi:hypothetical protein